MKFDMTDCIKQGVVQAMKECELTIGMTLKEAVEKQIPKKPKSRKIGFESVNYSCPVCEQYFISQICGGFIAGQKYNYCFKCGQKIDW